MVFVGANRIHLNTMVPTYHVTWRYVSSSGDADWPKSNNDVAVERMLPNREQKL